MPPDQSPTEPRWGAIEDGVFRSIPRWPMEAAGLGPPPFDVTRPDGVTLHIVEEPETPSP